ncbi:MAG: hypothetical protein Q9187_005725 [Circinaria calcarea]
MSAIKLLLGMSLALFAALGLTAPSPVVPDELRPALSSRDVSRTFEGVKTRIHPPRKKVCDNFPLRIAGTIPPARNHPRLLGDLLSRHSRDSSDIVWCATTTDTYLSITFGNAIHEPGIVRVLESAYLAIQDHIAGYGDGIMAPTTRAAFNWATWGGFELHVWNSNNRRVTWGILASAVLSLYDFMDHHEFGSALFQIFDRGVQVGVGSVG